MNVVTLQDSETGRVCQKLARCSTINFRVFRNFRIFSHRVTGSRAISENLFYIARRVALVERDLFLLLENFTPIAILCRQEEIYCN